MADGYRRKLLPGTDKQVLVDELLRGDDGGSDTTVTPQQALDVVLKALSRPKPFSYNQRQSSRRLLRA